MSRGADERDTSEQLAQGRDSWLKTVHTSTVLREMTLLSSVFEVARTEWKACHVNPVRDTKRPSNMPPRKRPSRNPKLPR